VRDVIQNTSVFVAPAIKSGGKLTASSEDNHNSRIRNSSTSSSSSRKQQATGSKEQVAGSSRLATISEEQCG